MYKDNSMIPGNNAGASDKSFLVYFALQFLFIAAGMFINIKTGVATMLLTMLILPVVLYRCSGAGFDMSRWKNFMFYLSCTMGLYYFFEIGNPNNVQEAWNIAITHYWLYPIILSVVVPIAIRDRRGIEVLLIIWSIFIIIAALKGYWQKTHGFNARERYFLYVLGGWRTHIIWSGIRYFSFFSDAANYGVHAALASATLGISAFHVHDKKLKILFAVAALCGIYSMGISGTRAAMAVPLAAMGLYIVLSKSVKGLIGGIVLMAGIFVFFYYTDIANGNQYVRKMRSAFRPEEDPSYLLRVENRKKMKELMDYHPIGYGVGLSKGERFAPKETMPYPPDSWLVSVWIETGTIGLLLYLASHIVMFAWCSWIILFMIRDKQLRGLLSAWLCMAAGFFVSAYANDVMQYPNSIPLYTAFALCMAGPHIDKTIREDGKTHIEENKPKQYYRYYKNIEKK